jgi:hypothetical protein
MKKIMILFAILVLMMTALGCAVQQQATEGIGQQSTEQEAEDTRTVEEVLEPNEPAPPKVIKPDPQETKADKGVSAESSYNFEALPKDHQRKIKLVRNLLAEARSKEENYFYRYTGPGILQTDVWVKGSILKRTILRYDDLDKFKTYNMVYLDRNALTAKGYCETTKSKCWKGKGPFPESYSKWLIKTPKDWVLELDDNFYWALDNKISDQLYHIVDYKKNGKTIRVYVNDYRGIPGRVEVFNRVTPLDSIITGRADETYIYDDMDIGGVSDDDVTPPV